MENRKSKRFKQLTSKQYALFVIGSVGGMVMLINSLYLVFAGHVAGIGSNPLELPITYQIMLVVHVLIGLAFMAILIAFASLHFRKMRRYKNKKMRVSGLVLISILTFLVLSGFFILSEANSRENAWIFVGHQVAAALVIVIFLTHRLMSNTPIMRSQMEFSMGIALVSSLLIWLVHFTETGQLEMDAQAAQNSSASTLNESQELTPSSQLGLGKASGYKSPLSAVEGLLPFNPVGDPDPNSPFFPSKTSTATGGFLPARILTHDDLPDLKAFHDETKEKGFAPSYYLGAQSCDRCHSDIVQQWSTSAHRFSSFNNPFYRKSVELTRQDIGNKASQFCGGCHDPAVMMSGNMLKTIDPLTPESQAGLTCLSCHAIDKIHDLSGNGNYNIHDETESPYMFDYAKGGIKQEMHDYVLKAKPTVHKGRMIKPIFRKSEFCMTCHKVNLDVAVNDYRWLRGQNEYDAWQNSGVALNQPKTWYEPPTRRECQACHMPLEEAVLGDVAAKDGKVRSHRFLAVNTALPALRGDQDTIDRMEAFMQDDILGIDIFAVHREDGTVQMGLEAGRATFYPGEVLQLDIVVRNKNVGHTFPGGTNDSNQGWIDFEVSAGEETIYKSGAVDENRFVDPAAHFYQAVILDKNGHRIEKRNAADIYTVVYANVIGPSTSDIARYRFKVPEHAAGKKLTFSAKLMWRKFNQTFTNFVFEDEAEVPEMPITVMESDSLTFDVASQPAPDDVKHKEVEDSSPDQWVRFNDFAIGSFLDEDTKNAFSGFKKVTELQPEKMDGWLNLGRTYLKEGNLDKADEMLRKASELAPNQPRIAFFWGMLLEKSGRLEESIKAYSRVLQSYPDSRDSWSRLGRVYWLNQQIQGSIDAYVEVLRIDPENAQAFHQLSLAYKALTASSVDPVKVAEYQLAANEFETAFEKYKIDEDASAVTQAYRAKHPHDNKMSQKLIVHEVQKL